MSTSSERLGTSTAGTSRDERRRMVEVVFGVAADAGYQYARTRRRSFLRAHERLPERPVLEWDEAGELLFTGWGRPDDRAGIATDPGQQPDHEGGSAAVTGRGDGPRRHHRGDAMSRPAARVWPEALPVFGFPIMGMGILIHWSAALVVGAAMLTLGGVLQTVEGWIRRWPR